MEPDRSSRTKGGRPIGARALEAAALAESLSSVVASSRSVSPSPRGAMVNQEDGVPFPLAFRAAHAVRNGTTTSEVPWGAHVSKTDPLLSAERRARHVKAEEAPTDAPTGDWGTPPEAQRRWWRRSGGAEAVVRAPVDPEETDTTTDLGVPEASTLAPCDPGPLPTADRDILRDAAPAVPPETPPSRSDARRASKSARATRARRVRPLASVVVIAIALALCAGGAAAYAYFTSTGTGTGTSQGKVGSEITLSVAASTGPADLLPGGTGAAYFTLENPNPFSTSFNQVAAGAAVVSDNPEACPSSNVSIAPTLPSPLSAPITVSARGTSGRESIPGLVQLASDAPSTCQGVTFTVTLTLTGQST